MSDCHGTSHGARKSRGLRAVIIQAICIGLACSTALAVLRPTTSQRAEQFALLKTMAEDGTPVRVIVQLDVPDINGLTAASVQAKDPVAVDGADGQLRQAITQIADAELAKLTGLEYRVTRTYASVPFVALSVSQAALAAMEESPVVLGIREDHAYPPTLDETVGIVGADASWAQGYDGSGWYVAVLDTGIRDTHDFFTGKDIVQACFADGSSGLPNVGDCPNGLDVDTTSPHAAQHHATPPTNDHGTHVTGIATGHAPGVLSGVASGADVIAVQVFSQFFNHPDCPWGGDCVLAFWSDVAAALEYVYSLRTTYDIASVNMSLGGGPYFDQATCDADHPAVKAAIDNLRSAGIVTVVSAGNEYYCDSIAAPACISSAVAVGATDDTDVEAGFSNFHPDMLDVYAPGVAVFSSIGTSDSAYGNMSGTSMAAPHVAGAWAILKQAAPTAEVATILTALRSTGQPVSGRCEVVSMQRRIQIDAALACLAADCNSNGVIDAADIGVGASADCNNNCVPDECESQEDCQSNGVLDICDFALGTSNDCQPDGVPDECNIANGTSEDCNGNGVPDECELGTSNDCQPDGVPDECNIANGTSEDCNGNGVPDECEPDCNANGIADSCDIGSGTSADSDGNGVPDDCQHILFVDDSAPAGGDGSSWVTAYQYLQDALTAATSGDSIWVAEGTYRPDQGANLTPGDRAAAFRLMNGVGIYGGFAGYGQPDSNERDIITHETVLSGDLNEDDAPDFTNYADNSYHVVVIESEDVPALVDGCTISGGNADETPYAAGGGVHVAGSAATVRHCRIIRNSALNYGGGGMVAEWPSHIAVEDSFFLGNRGGGLCLYSEASSVRRCLFACNQGGLAADLGSSDVTECVLVGNSAKGLRFGNSAKLSHSVFAGNQGGGLLCDEALVELSNSLFVGNTSSYCGGAIANLESPLWASNCTIADNWSDVGGGGLCNAGDSTAEVRNTLFWGNADAIGSTELAQILNVDAVDVAYTFVQSLNLYAGLGNVGGDPFFLGSLIGTWTETAAYDSTAFQTTFHDANAAWGVDEHQGKFLNPDTSQYLQSLVVSNTATSITVWGDFAWLGAAGAEYEIRDYHLQWDSPCIDAGDNLAVPPGVITDLDGNSRLADDPDVPDAGNGTPPIVDMGAYEGGTAGFVLDAKLVTVPEGGTATLLVSLMTEPPEAVQVTVQRYSGDTDITVQSGAMLTFDASNYAVAQPVILAAETDADGLNDVTRIRVSAPSLPATDVTATEVDSDPLQVLYVDESAAGLTDGTNWAHAFTDLQDALALALAYPQIQEIRVAQGAYTPAPPSGDRRAAFVLVEGVVLKGGYAGLGAADPDERDMDAYVTILSGDLNGDDGPNFTNRDDNSRHVVMAFVMSEATILDGFTISGGNATVQDYFNDRHGGGLSIAYGNPTVSNCTFRANYADWDGGGLYNHQSNPTVTTCILSANRATRGGGMGNCYSNPTVSGCTFNGNKARSCGGGMYNYSSSPTVVNCTFNGNEARYRGGGMKNIESSPTVTNCAFNGNRADSGGGMYNLSSSPTLANCILWDPGAEIVNASDATVTVTYSNVQGGWLGLGNIRTDPLFADADGPDGVVGTEDDDLRLSPGSPCIDAGDNTAVPSGIVTDLDGNPRFVDDPFTPDTGNPGAPGPPIVDMGAYEYQPMAGDLDGDGDVDAADYAAFLAAFGHAVGDPEYSPSADLDGDGMITLVDYQLWLQCYRDYVGDPDAAAPESPKPEDEGGDSGVDTGNIRNVRRLPVQVEREPLGPAPRR